MNNMINTQDVNMLKVGCPFKEERELAIWEYQMRQVVKVSRQSVMNRKMFDMLGIDMDKMKAFMGSSFKEDIALLIGS